MTAPYPLPEMEHPDPVEALFDNLSDFFAGRPDDERAADSLRLAARVVEFAAYETARSGAAARAPELILMADRLMTMSAAQAARA